MNSKRIAKYVGYGTALFLLYAWVVVSTALGQSLNALDATSSFQIPAQPLPTALLRFTEQSGVYVTSSANLVESKISRGVTGQMDARSALLKILGGTTLSFERIDGSSVVIVPARTTLNPRSDEKRAVNAKDRRSATDDNEVVVTGSHIRGKSSNGSKIYSFDRADIAATGVGSVQEFLRLTPLNLTAGRSEASSALRSYRNSGQDNIGDGAGVNLRGLGNEATLVLLNGERMAPSGVGGFHDVSPLPLNAIERIEIVPDGMSAIYGSDAIGGVVNIIFRENFDGAETEARYGDVTDGGAHELSVGQIFGNVWQSGSVLLTGDYLERGPLLATDREYASDLWQGRNNLLPDEQRFSSLFRANQTLSRSIDASVDIYASSRGAENGQYNRGVAAQLIAKAETELRGGTTKLAWTGVNGWNVALAHTYSRTQNTRHTVTYWGPETIRTGFATELGISASELKAHGSLLHLPAGPAEVAIGIERRRESMALERYGGITRAAPKSSDSRSVDAAYVELQLPLITEDESKQRAVLATNVALRYEDFSDVGATDNFKFGAMWSPLNDLNVHATWGTSFRAPYLWQNDTSANTGLVLSVPNLASVTGRTILAVAYQGPHPHLGPERATTWTAGFTIGPDLLPTVRISGGYFSINYRDRITTPVVSSMPFGDSQQLALMSIPADPEVVEWVRSAAIYNNPNSIDLAAVEATLDGRTNNKASAKVSGIDFTLSSEAHTRIGVIAAAVDANYFTRFHTRVNRSAPYINVLDTLSNPVDFRGRGQLTWSNAGWSALAAINYVDDYTDHQRAQPRRISSWTTIDLGSAYTFGATSRWLRDLTLRVNVINVTNKAPPRVYDLLGSYGDPGYDPASANPLGRFISFQISKAW